MKIFVRLFVIFATCQTCYWSGVWMGHRGAPDAQDAEIRSTFDDSFNALAAASSEMTKNTDVLMRFSHYTDYHRIHTDVDWLACPECSGSTHKELVYPGTEIDTKPDQNLQDDAYEVLHGIKSLRFGLIMQNQALEHTLKRLRSVNIVDANLSVTVAE